MMKKYWIIIPLIAVASTVLPGQSSEFYDYIEKYKKVAISEMERAGVPASIKLAQGILESNAGRSELARRANNHFGMKCGSSWSGRTYEKEDDDYDEFGNLIKSCFRRYRRATDSYIAHSEFLRDPRKAHRYGFLFRLDPLDYKRWARGLRRAGYATAAGYDTKLVRLIETYELFRFDQLAVDNLPLEKPEGRFLIAGYDVRLINDIKVVIAKNKITVQDISIASGVSVNALKRYNDDLPAVSDSLTDNYRVFLQPKRCRYRGKRKWHYVDEGETMFGISQEYGVKLSRLLKRNRVPEGSEPQPDERIKLKGCKVKKGERPRLQKEQKPDRVPVPVDPDTDFMDEDITPLPPVPPVPDPGTGPGTTQPDTPAEMYYNVIKGDTLYNISRRYGLTVDDLMKLNNLSSTTLSIGQRIRVK